MSRGFTIDTVILDCDSTLSAIEGIDELARRAGVYDRLAPLTNAAMSGEIRLEDVYHQRLALIQPSRVDIDWLGSEYVNCRLSDAEQVITALQNFHRDVHIVSGGIRQAVLILAKSLSVAPENVHAVDLRFNASGQYQGYDETSPLTRNNGKKTVCRIIVGDSRSAVLVGDGMTDLVAKQEGVEVIGFGGIVSREVVKNRAEDFIAIPSLEPLLERVLTQEELGHLHDQK